MDVAFDKEMQNDSEQWIVIIRGAYDRQTDITKERNWLSVRFKGLGIISQLDRQDTQYIGGIVKAISPLLKNRTTEGVKHTGRLDTDEMREQLGEHYSNRFKAVIPWEVLAQRGIRVKFTKDQ